MHDISRKCTGDESTRAMRLPSDTEAIMAQHGALHELILAIWLSEFRYTVKEYYSFACPWSWNP